MTTTKQNKATTFKKVVVVQVVKKEEEKRKRKRNKIRKKIAEEQRKANRELPVSLERKILVILQTTLILEFSKKSLVEIWLLLCKLHTLLRLVLHLFQVAKKSDTGGMYSIALHMIVRTSLLIYSLWSCPNVHVI